MTGALLQLASSTGGENAIFNGNPKLSFYKKAFRSYSNFATETFRIDYTGTPTITEKSSTTFTFPVKRHGDLFGTVYLVLRIPAIYSSSEMAFQWIRNLGSMFVLSASLYFSGQKICEIRGENIHSSHRLSKSYATNLNYNDMIGHAPALYHPRNPTNNTYPDSDKNATGSSMYPSIDAAELYIPLNFYFTQNTGSYLPLVALQGTEVEIVVETRPIGDLYTVLEHRRNEANYGKRVRPTDGSQSILQFTKETTLRTAFELYMDANYVFLETPERTKFAANSHEYLIQQIQYKDVLGITAHRTIDLMFSKFVKEVRFVVRKSDVRSLTNEWSNYGNTDGYRDTTYDLYKPQTPLSSSVYRNELTVNGMRIFRQLSGLPKNGGEYRYTLQQAKFLMNGQERTRDFGEKYWRVVQPFQHHVGSTVYPFENADDIYSFSFALEPDTFQPSGACPMDNLQSFQLDLTTQTPPTEYRIVVVQYVMNTTYTSLTTSWRNPQYSASSTIHNTSLSVFSFYSIHTDPAVTQGTAAATVYGAYTVSNNPAILAGTYIVKITGASVVLTSAGVINNQRIVLDGATMAFYQGTNVRLEGLPNYTTTVNSGEIVFAYVERPSDTTYAADFFALNLSTNDYDTYNPRINNATYLQILNAADPTGGLATLYAGVFQSAEQVIANEIAVQVGTANKPTQFTFVSIDVRNKILYGVLRVYQGVNAVSYNCKIDYVQQYATPATITNQNNTKTSYLVVPLTSVRVSGVLNGLITLYTAEDTYFENPLVSFPQEILSGSILILRVEEQNSQNPEDLKRYVWRYDVMVEAHSYNLLRISGGMGGLVF